MIFSFILVTLKCDLGGGGEGRATVRRNYMLVTLKG